MLKLQNITKTYVTGDMTLQALDGIDIEFRKSEFVSILGPSGCGKTTLLNIVGGLDRYTDGDLTIKGKSTKKFTSNDWDSYRNHSVGFVFQSYNLIPHQSILANVELALTLSGISKSKRKEKARKALEEVGLGEHINKRPNQLSGGQMQRVAIARAIINDPEILLADEPTGALDSQTSVQVMQILKEISKDRLVIMVTHNPELAIEYSDRIVKLKDGKIIEDSSPYKEEKENTSQEEKKVRKPSMSLFTALSLSLNNLMTKKGRTLLTSFAGSIGIIGIALILAISNGIQSYINTVQEETLSAYPLIIEAESFDMSSMFETFANNTSDELTHERDKIYTNSSMYDLMSTFFTMESQKNNLTDFKAFIESEENGVRDLISTIKYGYQAPLYIYSPNTTDGILQINPSTVMDFMTEGMDSSMQAGMSMMSPASTIQIWEEMIDTNILDDQYDIIAGKWPQAYNEVVLIVDRNNELSDTILYSLGMKDQDELPEMMQAMLQGKPLETESPIFEYEDILNMSFKLVLPVDFYKYDEKTNTYEDMRENETYISYLVDKGESIKIVGIIRPSEDTTSTAMTGAIGYTSMLTEHVINAINNSEIVKKQLASPDTDIIENLPFITNDTVQPSDEEKASAIKEYISSLSVSQKADLAFEISKSPTKEYIDSATAEYMKQFPNRASMEEAIIQGYSQSSGVDAETMKEYFSSKTDEEILTMMTSFVSQTIIAEYEKNISLQFSAMTDEQASLVLANTISGASTETLASYYDEFMPATHSERSYTELLELLGVCNLDSPSTISIYAKTFAEKDLIKDEINKYNKLMEAEGKEENIITYTDYVGMLMSSITTIINAISYVLIAFVSTSLVVSSIMIGIITYISVLERTKEIGILRAMGASKRDVTRVFNAETLIVGFSSGIVGIGLTLLISIPANIIIENLTDIANMVLLPVEGAIALVIISMFLTFIAGLLPALIASNKDPVIALRTE